jgi:hypothetical protein
VPWFVAPGTDGPFKRPGFVAPDASAQPGKEQPRMSIALRNKQLLILVILAFLTVLIISFVLLGAVAHINVFHIVGSLLGPNLYFGNG